MPSSTRTAVSRPDTDPESWQQTGRRSASQFAYDTSDLFTQPNGPSLVSLDHARHLLPERPARALCDRATHPTDAQPHHHPASIDRHIRGDPLMEGVNPTRPITTSRTRHLIAPGRCPHHDHIASVLDILDRQRRQPREHRADQLRHLSHKRS
jgi:hypothetical protein